MVTSLLRKSITDLSRRRSRTFFAVTTLALAVAGIGLFATPTLMNRAMSAEVTADRLPDLTISTGPLVLNQAQLAALAAVPNVRAVQPRSSFGGRVYVGARRAFAQVLGIPDFPGQAVNVVHVTSGAAPGTGAVLTDAQNAKQGLLDVQAGQIVRIIAADGAVRSLRVSGGARNLDGGQTVTSDSVIVLYATPATVASLSRTPATTSCSSPSPTPARPRSTRRSSARSSVRLARRAEPDRGRSAGSALAGVRRASHEPRGVPGQVLVDPVPRPLTLAPFPPRRCS